MELLLCTSNRKFINPKIIPIFTHCLVWAICRSATQFEDPNSTVNRQSNNTELPRRATKNVKCNISNSALLQHSYYRGVSAIIALTEEKP